MFSPAKPFAFALLSLFLGETAPAVAEQPSAESAIDRGLEHVRVAGEKWIDARGCVSCHQVPTLVWSHELARQSGRVDGSESLSRWESWSTQVVNFVKPQQKATCDEDAAMAGNIDTMTGLLLAIPTGTVESNWRTQFTDKLVREQMDDGSWKACGQLPMQKRPKRETNAVTTLWTTLALAKEDARFEVGRAIAFADSVIQPQSAEYLAARLLVADQLASDDVAAHQTRLLDHQNDDGGWGFLLHEPSDALGTGYALYALAKTTQKDPNVLRAKDYLVQTQMPDGKWKVPGTKATANGKPTATANDWGTAWAVMALLTLGD